MVELVQTAERQKRYWWRKAGEPKATCAVQPRPGQTCTQCGQGALAYNGLFMLTCPACGHIAESGVFT